MVEHITMLSTGVVMPSRTRQYISLSVLLGYTRGCIPSSTLLDPQAQPQVVLAGRVHTVQLGWMVVLARVDVTCGISRRHPMSHNPWLLYHHNLAVHRVGMPCVMWTDIHIHMDMPWCAWQWID